MIATRRRAGVTLVELMVVLVLLGLMAGVVGLAWRPNPARKERGDTIAEARHRALETGAPVRVQISVDGKSFTIAALPDGRLIAPGDVHVDPLTGMPVRE